MSKVSKRDSRKRQNTVHLKICQKKAFDASSKGEPDSSFSDNDVDLSLPFTVGDFCLVKFVTEEDLHVNYYVGEIIQLHTNAYELSFLRKTKTNEVDHTTSFVFRDPDITTVSKDHFIRRLLPTKRSGTARQNRVFTFQMDFLPKIGLY